MLTKPIFCNKTTERKRYVEYFYRREQEIWHRTVHKNGGSVVENVKVTLDSISPEAQMYVVSVGSSVAAFFCKCESPEGKVLEGFHIGKQFRQAWFFEAFWKEVRKVMGSEFYVGVCEKNEKAFCHLKKQGFLYLNTIESDHKYHILKSN